jgi:hypothetical protein
MAGFSPLKERWVKDHQKWLDLAKQISDQKRL